MGRTELDKRISEEIRELESGHACDPKHVSDKRQVHAAGGLGVSGILGVLALEAIDFVGEHIAELVGGGTGIGLIIFFIFKFFEVELEELGGGHEVH